MIPLGGDISKVMMAMESQWDCHRFKQTVCSSCSQGPWVSLSPPGYHKKSDSPKTFDLPAKWTAYKACVLYPTKHVQFSTFTL